MLALLNRSQEHWALLRSTDQPNTNLALFVHGFRGGYLSTWGKLPDFLREHSGADPRFREWDYLFVGYNTRRVDAYLDIARLMSSQWTLAKAGDLPYAQSYSRLALFGHSLGTLGIRQMLCAWSEQPSGLIDAVHSVTLFGTPLNGSPLALLAFGYAIRDALKPRNPQLRMLRAWAQGAHAERPWPEVRVILGQDDRLSAMTSQSSSSGQAIQ